MTGWGRQDCKDRKTVQGLPGARAGKESDFKGIQDNLWSGGNTLLAFVKTHLAAE